MLTYRTTRIRFPVFADYSVRVVVSKDIESALLLYKETREFNLGGTTEAMAIHVDDGRSFLFLEPGASPGTIAHETWHVVQHMLEYFQVDIEAEIVAYHLGYLVDKIYPFVHKSSRRPSTPR